MLHVARGPLLLHESPKAAHDIMRRQRCVPTCAAQPVCLFVRLVTLQGLRGCVLRARRFSAHVIRRCHRPRQAPKPMLHLACLTLHLACLTLLLACLPLHLACLTLHLACLPLHLACLPLHLACLPLHLACLPLPTSACPAPSGTALKSLREGCSLRLPSCQHGCTHARWFGRRSPSAHVRRVLRVLTQDHWLCVCVFQEDGNGPLLPSNSDGRESLAAHQPLVLHRHHAHSTHAHAHTPTKPRTPAHAPSAGVRGFARRIPLSV
jgi:hypothetical protein